MRHHVRVLQATPFATSLRQRVLRGSGQQTVTLVLDHYGAAVRAAKSHTTAARTSAYDNSSSKSVQQAVDVLVRNDASRKAHEAALTKLFGVAHAQHQRTAAAGAGRRSLNDERSDFGTAVGEAILGGAVVDDHHAAAAAALRALAVAAARAAHAALVAHLQTAVRTVPAEQSGDGDGDAALLHRLRELVALLLALVALQRAGGGASVSDDDADGEDDPQLAATQTYLAARRRARARLLSPQHTPPATSSASAASSGVARGGAAASAAAATQPVPPIVRTAHVNDAEADGVLARLAAAEVDGAPSGEGGGGCAVMLSSGKSCKHSVRLYRLTIARLQILMFSFIFLKLPSSVDALITFWPTTRRSLSNRLCCLLAQLHLLLCWRNCARAHRCARSPTRCATRPTARRRRWTQSAAPSRSFIG